MGVFIYSLPNLRDLAIVINIENDTAEEVDVITFEKDNGQIFSGTLDNKQCSLSVLYSGDTDFKVFASMKSGEVKQGSIGYADPRSNRNIFISELK